MTSLNPTYRKHRWLFFLLAFALLFADLAVCAEEAGLFSRLKAKVTQKIDQVTDRDWLLAWSGGKATGFLAGKAAGLLGLGLGMVIGSAVGGPAGAALGGYIGFRIADVVTKTFARAFGREMIQRKLDDQPFDFKATLASLDKKALTVESIGAALGDLVGGTIGIALGVSLLGGIGPIAIPLIGTVAGVVLGRKLGSWAGRALGRGLGRVSANIGYQAFIAGDKPPASVSVALASATAPTSKIPLNSAPATAAVGLPPIFTPASAAARLPGHIDLLYQQYLDAYQRYTEAQADPGISAGQRAALQKAYQQAYTQWLEARSGKR